MFEHMNKVEAQQGRRRRLSHFSFLLAGNEGKEEEEEEEEEENEESLTVATPETKKTKAGRKNLKEYKFSKGNLISYFLFKPL